MGEPEDELTTKLDGGADDGPVADSEVKAGVRDELVMIPNAELATELRTELEIELEIELETEPRTMPAEELGTELELDVGIPLVAELPIEAPIALVVGDSKEVEIELEVD